MDISSRRGQAPWLSGEEGVPARNMATQMSALDQLYYHVQGLRPRAAEKPSIGRETESQREDKNCPSSHSKEMEELKPRERFSDSSSRASSMMSYGLRKPGVIWLTQQGSEEKVVTPPKLCSGNTMGHSIEV